MKILVAVFVLCLTLMVGVLPRTVSAQEELQIDTITPTATPSVNYPLPYPGILPDNPLYGLKAARDRIISFFIADPVKKAQFDLLQADKRLQAGLLLLHKEHPNTTLAISTISKGENYFEEALHVTEQAERNKTDVGDVPDHLVTAAQKHRELLHNEKSISKDDVKDFATLLSRVDQFVSQAQKLQKQK